MKKNSKKIILSLILIGLVSQPLRARAFWGIGDLVADPAAIAAEIEQVVADVTKISNLIQNTLKVFGLDVVIYKVSQQMSQKLLNKVLNKANGGASGDEPKLFIENFGQYFQDIANQQIGSFTNSLESSNNPFAQSIIVGISNQAKGLLDSGGKSPSLDSFSLDKMLPEGVSWQDAAQDITQAGSKGWDFYGSLSMPQNSPLGSSMIAQDELVKKINNAKKTAETELKSSGFKPDKFDGAIESVLTGKGMESFSNVNTDGKIKSPSETNLEQAKQSVNESFDRLRNADTFGKIIFNTITQMITGLIQKGFSSLKSDGGAVQKAYGGPKDVNSSAVATNWTSAPQQVVDLRSSLDVSIKKTQIEIDSLEKTMASVKKPVDDGVRYDSEYIHTRGTIVSLEACIPGPDTGFEQRLLDYVTKQTKDTRTRGGRDNDSGSLNTDAYTKITKEVDQALLESKSLMSNPFLNIPAAGTMKAIVSEYYQTANKFKGLINNLIEKRQVLTTLQTIQAEARSFGTSANNGKELILSDTQWDKLIPQDKEDLYTALTPEIITDFPEYLVEDYDIEKTTTSTESGIIKLRPIPKDDPVTPQNEYDDEMKKRIFDQQWNKWENIVDEKNKQALYARFISISRDISDSSSAQRAQTVAESAELQYEELKNALSDCISIRKHLLANPQATATDPDFIKTLKSSRIRTAYSGPSILTARDNNVDFDKLNESIVGNEPLQIMQLAKTASEVINQDEKDLLFCRLRLNELTYWAPKKLTGDPIGCGHYRPNLLIITNTSAPLPDPPGIITINYPAGGTSAKAVNPTWYRTNNAEILFSVMGKD